MNKDRDKEKTHPKADEKYAEDALSGIGKGINDIFNIAIKGIKNTVAEIERERIAEEARKRTP